MLCKNNGNLLYQSQENILLLEKLNRNRTIPVSNYAVKKKSSFIKIKKQE